MDNPYNIMIPENTQNEDIPYVVVYNPDLTYEQIHKRQMETEIKKNNTVSVQGRKHYTPLQRILIDIVGPVVLYASTFIVCDMLNTIATGRWTSITRMITGLWDYRHNFMSDFREFILNILQELVGNTVDCDKKRNYGYDYCDATKDGLFGLLWSIVPGIPDLPSVADCKAKVDEKYDDCYGRTDEGQCSATATDYFNQCMIDTSTKTAPPPPPGVITTENWNHTYWTEECYRSSYTGYTNCLSGVDGYAYNDTWPTDY